MSDSCVRLLLGAGHAGLVSFWMGRTGSAGHRAIGVAEALTARLSGLAARVTVVDGRAMTTDEVAREHFVLVPTVDRDRGMQGAETRPLRFVGGGLLLVTAVGLATVGGVAPWLDGDGVPIGVLVAAVVMACTVVAVQTALACRLGARLYALRHARTAVTVSPLDDAALLSEAGALATMGAFAGGALFLWAQDRLLVANGQVGQALGLALAVSAWVAPFMLVSDIAYRPSPQRKRLAALARVLREVDEIKLDLHPQIRRLLARAEAQLSALEQMNNEARSTAESCGFGTDPGQWQVQVDLLAEAVRRAREAYAAVLAREPGGRLDRGDVGLAG